jgi:hypothetical protein
MMDGSAATGEKRRGRYWEQLQCRSMLSRASRSSNFQQSKRLLPTQLNPVHRKVYILLLFLLFLIEDYFVTTAPCFLLQQDSNIISSTVTTIHAWQSGTLPKMRQRQRTRRTQTMMIRNIDLPEAVILYGTKIVIPSFVMNESDEDALRRFQDNILNDDHDDMRVIQARKGLGRFIQECHSVQTAVVVLLDNDDEDDDDHDIIPSTPSRSTNILETVLTRAIAQPCHVYVQTTAPPNPSDLLTIVGSLQIQPRPYGGSASTIGYRRAADPERLVDPKHCVVVTSTIDQTRVARALGMRVVSIHADDVLADAVLTDDDDDDDDVSFHMSVDDIATPGSYWLNPPHPRDDHGNQVRDPYDILRRPPRYEHSPMFGAANLVVENSVTKEAVDDDDEASFQAILADMSPL